LAELLRALMEGIGLRIAAIVDLLKKYKDSPIESRDSGRSINVQFVGTGSALAKSKLLQTVIADCTGENLYGFDGEGTSLGVALLAREVAGYGSIDSFVQQQLPNLFMLARPDKERYEVYENDIKRRHREFYGGMLSQL